MNLKYFILINNINKNMTDKVKNYYELLPKDLKQERKVDNFFKKHYIQPCSMICCIGGTGSGKTNALIDFLNRKNNAFYDIIIFSGSTVEEPLYNLLKQKMPEIKLYNNIEDFPSLSEFDNEDKDPEIRMPILHLTMVPLSVRSQKPYRTISSLK
jgi:ABC-type proline/glycine betaine transport system ATPase subunit